MHNAALSVKNIREFLRDEGELKEFKENYSSYVSRLFDVKTKKAAQKLADDISPFVKLIHRWNFDPSRQRCIKGELDYVKVLKKGLEERAEQLGLGEIEGVDIKRKYPTLAHLAEEYDQTIEVPEKSKKSSQKENECGEVSTLEAIVEPSNEKLSDDSSSSTHSFSAENKTSEKQKEQYDGVEEKKLEKVAAEPSEIISSSSNIDLRDVDQFFEKNHLVGEKKTRLISTLGTAKKMSFGYVSLSGSGKSKSTYLIMDMFGPGIMYVMELGSDTVISYEAETINQHQVIFIPELQKAMDSGNQIVKELLKNVTEGRDGSRKVRNAGKGINETYSINGDLGVMFAMTPEHSYDSEFSRRVFVLQTDISPEQTRRVIDSIANQAHAKEKRKIRKSKKLTEHVNRCLELNGKLEYEIPFAEYVAGFIPERTVRARSYANYLFDMVNASAQFHHGDRTFDDNVLFADLRDSHLIMEKLFWKQYMKGLLGIPLVGEETLAIFQENDEGLTADQIYFKHNEINQDINEKVSAAILDGLSRSGFLYREQKKGKGGAKYFMRRAPPNLELQGFSMQKCLDDSVAYITREYGKSVCDNWLDRQVSQGNKIMAYDPFGGPDTLLVELK